MAQFASQAPSGQAVQQMEILVRAAIFKPAAELVALLLQQAIDRIDAAYQAKPGEHSKGRQVLEVQCLFGSFALARDYLLPPGAQGRSFSRRCRPGAGGRVYPGPGTADVPGRGRRTGL